MRSQLLWKETPAPDALSQFANKHSSLARASLDAGCKTYWFRTNRSRCFGPVTRSQTAIIARLRLLQLNSRFEDYWEAAGERISTVHVAHLLRPQENSIPANLPFSRCGLLSRRFWWYIHPAFC